METVLANRYIVRSVLGEGGMGTVYRVADRLAGMQEVALKTIKAAGEITDDQRLRFKEEFRAMARLKHPNTIAVLDFGQLDAHSLYITMELVPGRELADVMGGRQMPLAEVYPLLIQLLQAMNYIHARLYVHRDIKSQNIRVDDDGRLVLMDFGLMGQLGQPSTRKVTGSPGYLAPEVAIGGLIDASSDLYSVGCLAYEMLSGRLPFTGSLIEVVRAHIGTKPPKLTELRPDLPARLERIVARLMEKEQARRYRTAAEVLDDMAAVAGVAIATASRDQQQSYLVTSQLVGRVEELSMLEEALHASLAGKGQAIMVGAPAGTGKSRLVQELLLQAKLEEVLVMHGECLEAGMAPYEALSKSLRPALAHGTAEEGERHQAALARLFPDFAKSHREGPVVEGDQLAAATIEWLSGLSERVPLLWLMDDLHWADPQTLEVFNHCIRNLGPARILCLGTFRNDETPAGSPVWYTLEEGAALALTLGPLTPESQLELLGAMLAEYSIGEPFAEALYGATGGNAFFLTEVLRALMEDGELVRQGGRWIFPTDARVLAPLGTIEATVSRRLAKLGKEARRLAGVAAVIGRHQDLTTLRAVVGQEDEELFGALDELLQRQFLNKEEQGFSFPHDRVREVLYHRMDPAMKRELHQRAGEHLEAHPGADSAHQLHELARHFDLGTDTARAFKYLMLAAEQADEASADAIALDLWQRADRVLESLDVPDKLVTQVRLRWTIGRNSFVLAPHAGIAALTKVASVLENWQGPRPADPAFDLGGVYAILATVQSFAGFPRDALRSAERSSALLSDENPSYQGARLFVRSLGLMTMGHVDEAVAIGKAAAKLLGPSVENGTVPANLLGAAVGSHSVQNVVVYQGYRPDPVLRDRTLAIARLNNDPNPFTVLMPFGMHDAWAGRVKEAQRYVEDTIQKCRQVGSPPYPFMLYVRVHLRWQRGDFAGAIALADQALALPNVQQFRQAEHFIQGIRALALLDLGRIEEARQAADAMEADAIAFDMQMTLAHVQIVQGCIALAAKDLGTARDKLTQAYRNAETGPTRNPLCQIWSGRALGRLATLERDFARARRLLDEARSIAARPEIDLPLEQAHCHMALADLERLRGDLPAARRELGLAGDIFHKLENPFRLHAVLEFHARLEGQPEVALPAAADASVESRWKLMRGAML